MKGDEEMKLFKKKRTNRIFSLIIATVMVISAVNMTVMPTVAEDNTISTADVPAAYSEGEADLIIHTAEELWDFRDDVNRGNDYSGMTVELANDIDLADLSWVAIGYDVGRSFRGTFDGKGHSITGFNVTGNDMMYYGLFGVVEGDIKNLEVEGKISSTFDIFRSIGGIAGNVQGNASITN